MTKATGSSELVGRLRARAAKVQSHIENSRRVVELMQSELDRFEAREGHNVYATRLAVDHVSAIRTDTKELADWTEAADRITDLEARLARAEEALRLALPRLAHKHSCWSVRPTSEWAEHGSASFENCNCEIKAVRAALQENDRGRS